MNVDLTTRALRLAAYTEELLLAANGRWVVSWSRHSVRIFDAGAEAIPAFREDRDTAAVAAAGDVIAIGFAGDSPALRLLRGSDLSRLEELPLPAPPTAVALSPSGDRLAWFGKDGVLCVLDLTRSPLAPTRERAFPDATSAALAFSPDGARIAVAPAVPEARSSPVEIVDAATLTTSATLKGARAAPRSLAFSPSGAELTAATLGAVLAWTLPRGKARTLLKAKSYAQIVGYVTEQCLVLIDHREAIVAVDPGSSRELWRHPSYGPASLDSAMLVHARFETLFARDPATGELLHQVETRPFPDRLVADAARGRALVNVSRGRLLKSWTPGDTTVTPSPDEWGGPVTAAAADRSGLVIGTAEPTLHLFDLRDGSPRAHIAIAPGTFGVQFNGKCGALCLDPDHLWAGIGRHVARLSRHDGRLEASSAELKDDVVAVSSLPELGLVVACADASRRSHGELTVLDATSLVELHAQELTESTQRIHRLGHGHVRITLSRGTFDFDPRTHQIVGTSPELPWSSRAASFDPKGQFAATYGSERNHETKQDTWSLQLWSLSSSPAPPGEPRVTDTVHGVLFLAAPTRLVSLHDGVVRLWSVPGLELTAELAHSITSADFFFLTPDGTRAVVASQDGSCELVALTA